MVCKLDLTDCFDIENAAFRLNLYSKSIKKLVDEYTEDYGKESVLVKSVESRLKDVTLAHTGLLKIANKCGCNIDIKTSIIKK